ncbi:MAG: GNAT family N-acetyltransferase [Rubrobacteraceae bacterium]|nr:GNAT family N-acetyltransferase [Rubrobacter sp.]
MWETTRLARPRVSTLATKAARTCLHYAFTRTNLERVVAGADAPNIASLRVIEKLGMKPVGEISPGQPGVPFFALNRDDFHAMTDEGA